MNLSRTISVRSIFTIGALALLTAGGAVEASAQALPLRPMRADGKLPIIPIMEGWWDNADGSATVSFGYLNRNEQTVEIPVGADNAMTPNAFGAQVPSAFLPGRHFGAFTLRLPNKATEVWWTINSNGESLKVPGRATAPTYMLDYLPRPHGTVAPRVWFAEGEVGQNPEGIVASRSETARVGELKTLSVNVMDPSVRDPSDYRFKKPLSTTVAWFKHSGPPGEIEWVRHSSTPMPAPAAEGSTAARRPAPVNEIVLPDGKGVAQIQARFPAPGEYVIRVLADQFDSAPDSSGADQCCWTNGFLRVTVTP